MLMSKPNPDEGDGIPEKGLGSSHVNWGGPVPGHADSKTVNSKTKSSSTGMLRIDLNRPTAALSLNPTSDFVSFSSLEKADY